MKKTPWLSFLSLVLLADVASAALQTTFVASDLRDPMEISLAPNGDVFVVEREGRVLRVVPATGAMFVIGQVPVTALKEENKNSSWAREDGLLGITLDPDFTKNQRLYLYYSAADQMLNRLSRFSLKDGLLDLSSEKMLLEIPTDRRDRVCHHGGSLAFGKDGLLYLSTGDNTNPFESNGVAPIDDRDGHDHANAMRSAGNTNDLRGKVLRIKPTENGYEIPEGNLFPKGNDKARPEIFVMGCRNPFRMSIDPKTNTVYWGEVGPDAGNPSDKGPAGHDEVNQAKTAGNHGWPFVIADNQPYPIVDFTNGKPGVMIDPAAPKNPSKLNTGLTELPAARAALIWYPYAASEKFPLMGTGGRNAMAGPVFYYDAKRTHNILGEADDRSLITYEWMRNKAWKVKLDEKENFVKMEVLLEGLQHPMDMEMAADGSVVLLEYGSEWYFNRNGRIRLILPDSGNQAPEVKIEDRGNKNYAVAVKDPENQKCEVVWYGTKGQKDAVLGKGETYTLNIDGVEQLRAVVTDEKGQRGIARVLLNASTMPELTLSFPKKPSAIGFGETVAFQVAGAAQEKDVVVRARYIPPTGHDAGGPVLPAQAAKLIEAKQCLACHQVDANSVGPSYLNVAMRYRDDPAALKNLQKKLSTGGAGAWGEIPMPPQAAVNEQESAEILQAILGLSQGMAELKTKAAGDLKMPAAPEGAAPGGAWEIIATAPMHTSAKIRIPAK
jgi:cytochrome c